MDAQDLANSLFGASRMEETTLNTMSTLQGVAVADSADGYVKVKIAGESTPEEEGATEPNTVVNLPTTPSVKEGDTVTITAEGGALKVMTVTGNTGSGDRAKQATDDAAKVATNYIDIDENKGITVGNMTDETLGKNAYIDANGFYVRDGEKTLASFTEDEIALGKNSSDSTVSLCNNSASMYANDEGAFFISTKNTSSSTAIPSLFLRAGDVYRDKETLSANIDINPVTQNELLKNKVDASNYVSSCAIYESDTEISATCQKSKVGSSDSTYSTSFKLDKNGFYIANNGASDYGLVYGETVLYNNTSGTTGTVTLSQSAANFTYLEIFFNCQGNACSSVKVYSPNGKKVQLQQTFWAEGTTTSQTDFETVTISGTSITRGTMGFFQTVGTAVNTGTVSRQFNIVRVVGLK